MENPRTATRLPSLISKSLVPLTKSFLPTSKKSAFKTSIRALIHKFKHPRVTNFNNSGSPYGPEKSIHTRPKSPSNQLTVSGSNTGDANFKEKVLYLELMGVDIQKAIKINPAILSTSLDNIEDVVNYLQQMGMMYKDLGKTFGMFPQVLTYSIDEDLIPVFNFLIDEAKIPRKELRKCISKNPKLLVCSVRDQLRPTLHYLKKLGFQDSHHTGLLVQSVEKSFIPKVEYLQSLGISCKKAKRMVVRCPGILASSVENNLQPKFEYLINEMGGSIEDLMEFPQYFGFSLEERIKPRHRLLVEHNVALPLPDMLKKNEEEFMDMLQQGPSTSETFLLRNKRSLGPARPATYVRPNQQKKH